MGSVFDGMGWGGLVRREVELGEKRGLETGWKGVGGV